MAQLTREQAEGFYAVHKDRPFFNALVSFMISGPVMIQVLKGSNAVMKHREIMGATNPKEAAPGTIRADFADSIDANAVHGSDAAETAAQEIATKANENNIPTIILTKNSDFVPFGSVCRFAPTLEQQVDSLVRMVNAKYGFTKYGVVYPENTGKETLQAFRQKLVEFNFISKDRKTKAICSY